MTGFSVQCTSNNDAEENEESGNSWDLGDLEEIEDDERHPLLLIGIDGVKPSYLETYESSTSNLRVLAGRGVRAKSLKPVFPSHTFPNFYSIATGLYAENHGIINNTIYDSQRDEWFSIGNTDAHSDSAWWGGEPIWVSAEKQGLTASTFFWVGSEALIDGVQPTHWVAYDGRIPHNERTDQVIDWLTGDDPVDFATLYFSSPDGSGHQHGPDSSGVAESLHRVDDQLARLVNGLEERGLWPDINVIIVSDHGMTSLDEDKIVFLDDIIDLRDVNVISWTPVAMIEPDEGKSDQIYDQLAAQDDHYTVYWREDLPERFRLKNNDRVSEIVVVADMPYTLTSRSYFEERGLMSGGHGYDPDYEEMHGIFVALGPDFPQGRVTDTVEIVDIYALMTHLMGLTPADHDGSLERIGTEIFGE